MSRFNITDHLPEIASIGDSSLRGAVIDVWNRLWREGSWEIIEQLPTAPSIPYPHILHNRAIMKSALSLLDIYQQVHGIELDRDLILAGAALQDASKLVEYQFEESLLPGCALSEIGSRLQHGVYGAHVALDEGLSTSLAHIILSHSPQSAMKPTLKEAIVLYHIDQADIAVIHEVPIFDRKVVEYLSL